MNVLKKGESALHLACRHFFGTKVARYLINCGINVDEADSVRISLCQVLYPNVIC